MTIESRLPAHAWRVVALLWVVGCLNYLDRVMLTTMRGSIKEAIPMTEAQFGSLTAAFLLVYALLSPFAGFLADRFNRSRVIIISLLAWSAVTWLTAHARTYHELLLTRALMGISEACYIPAALALIADYHRDQSRSLANGVHMSGIMVGAGLGGVGGWIAERSDWAHAFEIFGMVGVGYVVVLMALLRDRTDPPEAKSVVVTPRVKFMEAVASLCSVRSFYLLMAYWALLGVVGWAVVGWMPTYLKEHFNLSQGVAGLSATGYLQASGLVGVILGGFLADRWSRTNRRGPILVPVVGLLVAAPSFLLASSTDLLPIAIGGLMVYGLTRAFADANMMPILSLLCDPRYRATGYGLLNFVSTAVGGAAIYAGGIVRDSGGNLANVFRFAAASMVVCAVMLFFVKPRSVVGAQLKAES